MGRPGYSRAHYQRVSPPPDQPGAVAERLRQRAAAELAVREREQRYPILTADNAAEAMRFQEQRIKELTTMKPNATHKVIGQIGDVNPTDHGGGIVYIQDAETGRASLEYTMGLESDAPEFDATDEGVEDAQLTVYQVDLGATGEEFFSDLDWVKWRDVADSIGMEKSELKGHAKSDNPLARASVAEAVAGYYGWHELDHYPQTVSYGDLDAQWFPRGSIAEAVGGSFEAQRDESGRMTNDWEIADALDRQDERDAFEENPGSTSYRGWTIEPTDGTQLGYTTTSGARGKGRKVRGYQLHGPDGAKKFVDTLKDAKRYIDEY